MLNLGGKYNKTVVALVAAIIGWSTVVVQSASDKITSSEWLYGGTLLAMALGVYTVANSGNQ
jgi:hypothetical protein